MAAVGAQETVLGGGKRSKFDSQSNSKKKRRKIEASAEAATHSHGNGSKSKSIAKTSAIQAQSNTQNLLGGTEDFILKPAGSINDDLTSVVNTSKPKLTRFGSEEPLGAAFNFREGSVDLDFQEIEINPATDDEGPEAVPAFAALENSRATTVRVAQAVLHQKLAAKKKRQHMAARLKKQAEFTQKRLKIAKNHEEEFSKTEASRNSTDLSNLETLARKKSRKIIVPTLLPAEVLATEFSRSPTPLPTQRQKHQPSSTLARASTSERPTREYEIGPVTVSILEKIDPLLPPKAAGFGMTLKESWCLGRRGKKGVKSYHREKVKRGFLRR